MSGRRIFLRDFRLKVSIGIHDFEKEGPQTVVVNVDLLLAPADKAQGDRIANVLNFTVNLGPQTAFAHVHRFPPGSLIAASPGALRIEKYWGKATSVPSARSSRETL